MRASRSGLGGAGGAAATGAGSSGALSWPLSSSSSSGLPRPRSPGPAPPAVPSPPSTISKPSSRSVTFCGGACSLGGAAAAAAAPPERLCDAAARLPVDAAGADRRSAGFEVSISEKASVKSAILGSICVSCERFAVISVTSPHIAHAHARAWLRVWSDTSKAVASSDTAAASTGLEKSERISAVISARVSMSRRMPATRAARWLARPTSFPTMSMRRSVAERALGRAFVTNVRNTVNSASFFFQSRTKAQAGGVP